MHMKPMNKDLYYKIQAKYAIPAVDQMWEEVQQENLDACADRDVVLLGEISVSLQIQMIFSWSQLFLRPFLDFYSEFFQH